MSSVLGTFAQSVSIASRQGLAALHKSQVAKVVRSASTHRGLVFGACGVVLAAIALRFAPSAAFQEQSCPAPLARAADKKPPSPFLPYGPAAFLKRARQAQGFELGQPWNSEATELLEQCVQWKPILNDLLPPLVEERAQLMCHNALVAPSWLSESYGDMLAGVASEAAEDLAVRRFKPVLGSVQGMVRQCKSLRGELRKLRGQRRPSATTQQQRSQPSANDAIVTAFERLASFEVPAREALETLQRITAVRRNATGETSRDEDLEMAASSRVALRTCVVDALRDARSLAEALPRPTSKGSACKSSSAAALSSMERFAIMEAVAESDAEVSFGAGLLLSQAAMAPSDVPMFDGSVSDLETGLDLGVDDDVPSLAGSSSGKRTVPRTMIMAEALLRRGFEATNGEEEVSKKASSRAGVLAYHAKFLMELGDGWENVAEKRYREAAEIARQHGRQKLASHALAQLAYFLSLRGFSEEALGAAEEAVAVDAGDPLAVHLRATLRLATGNVRTAEAALAAKNELAAVKGRLPNANLEADRERAHAVLAKWLPVARADTMSVCLTLGDIADILTCLAAKLAYTA
eukprot:TRINITY_DN4725_c0_g1_i2.p1 TRINITY_DN4725_c0_g1~~TRINITY_DN4725_c0_g1_i2.p1  ORF type:complete len:579 (+),score=118.55 TRINITY_DN4725_c0_g1_i2:98-1834(+)